MTVHSGIQAGFAVFLKSTGRHGQDGRVDVPRIGANRPRGIQPVHVRHLHVHQDHGVGGLLRHAQGFDAIRGQIHGQADIFQQVPGNLLVDRFVLCQQDACALELTLQPRFCAVVHERRCGGRQLHGLAKPGGEPEGAACAECAVHADGSAHHLRQPFADRQPQAGAAVLSGHRPIGLLESGEQSRLFVRADAYAGILNFEAQHDLVGRFLDPSGSHGDGAPGGELGGVAHQVEEDLPQPQGIAE